MSSRNSQCVRSRVSSDINELNILNMIYPWIPNDSQIRPTPEQLVLKKESLEELDKAWRSMRDYVLHEVFGKSVYIDTQGKLCAIDAAVSVRDTAFCPSHFPYNIQGGGRHWILWFGCHDEPSMNVNKIIEKKLAEHLRHDDFDFAWYANPKMSLPDFYHVHVFWVSFERPFPRRAFIQTFDNDRLPEDYTLVARELEARGIPFETRTTEDIISKPLPLERDDLVVGDFDWTRRALMQLRIAMPPPPDYPECLRHLLHRRVWSSTLGEVQDRVLSLESGPEVGIFVKPSLDAKAFSGLVVSSAWMEYLLGQFGPTFPVRCSDLIDISAEYRVYVVNGAIRCVCRYKGESDNLDMTIVEEAVRTLAASEEGRHLKGCSIDFATIRTKKSDDTLVTALIEVNDGFSLGAYPGLSGKDYTDLLIARWAALVSIEP